MRLLSAVIIVVLTVSPSYAYDLRVQAASAYLYHPATQTEVFAKEADKAIQPASLAKLMVLYLLFEALGTDRINLDSELPISKKAWKKGGSKMFLEVGKTARVEDLIRGIAVSSGNDASIVVAEYLGGTEDGFTSMMNAKARELGLTETVFSNATGWPDEAQVTTARDMTMLAAKLLRNFPQYYSYLGENVFTYNGIKQYNRNGLLRAGVGVDGVKTGHIEDAGYHLVSSGTEEGERLIATVMGTDGFAAREGESLKLLRYGFTQYGTVTLWESWQEVARAPVWAGVRENVSLVAGDEAQAYLKKSEGRPSKVLLRYNQPLQAPLQAGQQVGQMWLQLGARTYEAPLLVGVDVPQAGFMELFFQKTFYRLGL
jgi:D-alanyl-D-alanine carboxypeptidase (penicillin-binding protein 5/6)